MAVAETRVKACDTVKIIEREDRDEPVTIHYGLIASGNQVIKDARLRDKLNASLGGKVLCVEMEAAGLMESFPCLVIRGICDYADSHKNKKWQKYAALVAAAYAKELLMVVPCRAVEQMVTIQGIFSGISDKLDRISEHMENSQQSDQHTAILEWLTPVSYDSQQHSTFHRGQEGTCQWFLQSKEFRQFLQRESKIMFCEGFPGAGKTVLASIVINYLQHNHKSLPGEKIGLAFIFGDYVQRNHQRPVDILASLIKQLLRKPSRIPKNVRDLYDKYKGIAAASRSNKDNPVFVEMLQHVIGSIYTRVFLIMDALDELVEPESSLLEIFKILKSTSASLFATSRPIEKIQQQFQCNFDKPSPFEIRAHGEDIELYMDERLSHVKLFSDEVTDYSQEVKSQLKHDIKRKVSEVVDGIFLLAKLHIDALEDQTTPRKIREKLETLYQGPDAYAQAYKKTIDRINSQQPELRLLAKRALQWLTCSERALSNLELRHALSFNSSDTSLPDQDSLEGTHSILDVCMGLVVAEGHERSIRLIHYTALEFLRLNLACLDHGHQHPTDYDAEAGAQKYMTELCFTYILLGISVTAPENDIQSLISLERGPREKQWWAPKKGIVRSIAPAVYIGAKNEMLLRRPFLRYALEHFGHHAFKALGDGETCTPLDGIISKFLASSANVTSAGDLAGFYNVHSIEPGMIGLHVAARFGLKGAFKSLLGSTSDVDARDTCKRTPLLYAVEGGFLDIAQCLLKEGANPTAADRSGWTPLLKIAENGNMAMARLLLGSLQGKVSSFEKQKALQIAAGEGNEAVFRLLLDEGASPTYQNWEDSDPEARFARLPFPHSMRRTVLSLVAETGHRSIFDLLVSSGTDVDLKDQDGQTPLFFAVRSGRESIVEELLERGANPNSINDRGKTPLFYAAENGYRTIASKLLRYGGSLEHRDEDGQTPLFFAVQRGHVSIVEELLERGANPNSVDDDGETPLFHASKEGYRAIVSELVRYGGHLEFENRTHETPLLVAVRNGHEATAAELLRLGANPDVIGCKGENPVSLAVD
ncbi:ankyrin repeat-containing domain protein [Trichoderma aethiopicum]